MVTELPEVENTKSGDPQRQRPESHFSGSSVRLIVCCLVAFVAGILAGRADRSLRWAVVCVFEHALINYGKDTPLGSRNRWLDHLQNSIYAIEGTGNSDAMLSTEIRLLDHPDTLVRWAAMMFLEADRQAVEAVPKLIAIAQDPTHQPTDRNDARKEALFILKKLLDPLPEEADILERPAEGDSAKL